MQIHEVTLREKILKGMDTVPAKTTPAKTATSRQRDPKTGRYIGRGNSVFANMANQLAPDAATAAPTTSTTTSTGGTLTQTPTGIVHKAGTTNPNRPQTQAQTQEPVASAPAKTGINWGGVAKALGGHAVAAMGNSMIRTAQAAGYNVGTNDFESRVQSARVGADDIGFTEQQMSSVQNTTSTKVNEYLKIMGFLGNGRGGTGVENNKIIVSTNKIKQIGLTAPQYGLNAKEIALVRPTSDQQVNLYLKGLGFLEQPKTSPAP